MFLKTILQICISFFLSFSPLSSLFISFSLPLLLFCQEYHHILNFNLSLFILLLHFDIFVTLCSNKKVTNGFYWVTYFVYFSQFKIFVCNSFHKPVILAIKDITENIWLSLDFVLSYIRLLAILNNSSD